MEGNQEYALIRKMLKLDEFVINEKIDKPSFNVSFGRFSAVVFYEKQETEEDKILREKQIESLKASIAKREGLLNNQGFLSKAPKNLVDDERNKLEEEKKQLQILSNQ